MLNLYRAEDQTKGFLHTRQMFCHPSRIPSPPPHYHMSCVHGYLLVCFMCMAVRLLCVCVQCACSVHGGQKRHWISWNQSGWLRSSVWVLSLNPL